MRRIAAVAAMSLVFLGNARSVHGEPDKVQYELQERCGKAAASAFKDDYPDGRISETKDGQAIASFENHYSRALNKCFCVYTTEGLNYKSVPEAVSTTMTLFDVNEHKEYGSFYGTSTRETPFQCTVLGKVCHSENEWKDLIRAYMEN